MKKLPGLATFTLCSLFFVLCSASLGLVHAQEALEIPGPEIKDSSFVQVKELNIGDVVFVRDKGTDKDKGGLVPTQITKLEYVQEPVEVYNLSVDGEQTFFANDFAVHNKPIVDTTRPVCRVIINPTITNVNNLVNNSSFENILPCEERECCPRSWYNNYNEGTETWWCDYGLRVKNGGAAGGCTNCGSYHVGVWYPHYAATQVIVRSKLNTFSRYLYRMSAYGKGDDHPFMQLFEADGLGRRSHFNFCQGNGSCGWRDRSLLAWPTSASEQLIRLKSGGKEGYSAEFDLVRLEELKGLATGAKVNSLDIELYVAYRDDGTVVQLKHWNAGEGEPNWESPQVIDFGPNVRQSSNPISHTLRTGGDAKKTVKVKLKDAAGNVSALSTEACEATVTYIPPTGTITGNVYQNDYGDCNNGQVLDGWTATCNGIAAEKTGPTSYRCCADWAGGVCNPNLSYAPGGTNYPVSVTPPADYSITSCSAPNWAGSGPYTTSVLLNGVSASATDLYLWQGASAWFQTKEGDVHAQGGTISSKIFPDNTYFSDVDVGGYPGLVSYVSDDLPDFGRQGALPSEKGWLAKDGLSSRYSYSYFYRTLGSPETEVLGGEKLSDYISDHRDQEIFYFDEKITINEEWGSEEFPAGRKAIILINNDLEINKEIKVPVGRFFAFIVKGNINISGQIGDKSSASLTGETAHLQGVYLADGIINTYYDKGLGDGSGFRLVAAGIFVASDFNLLRDVKNECIDPETLEIQACNETTPSELFIARPDLFINIPEELKESYFFEQEVAP